MSSILRVLGTVAEAALQCMEWLIKAAAVLVCWIVGAFLMFALYEWVQSSFDGALTLRGIFNALFTLFFAYWGAYIVFWVLWWAPAAAFAHKKGDTL